MGLKALIFFKKELKSSFDFFNKLVFTVSSHFTYTFSLFARRSYRIFTSLISLPKTSFGHSFFSYMDGPPTREMT